MTEHEVFHAAVDITDPAERAAYLETACAGDAARRCQVEALLAAHERPDPFLDEPALEQMASSVPQPDNGTVALEAKVEGADIVAAREDPYNQPQTQAEQPGDGAEDVLSLLQPPTRPGSLG